MSRIAMGFDCGQGGRTCGAGARRLHRVFLCGLVVALVMGTSARADLYHVEMNLSSMAGHDIELDFSLYNDGGELGDSQCLISNIQLGSMTFDLASEEPLWVVDDGVNLTADSGGRMLVQITDTYDWYPVMATRDFSGIESGLTLAFDVEVNVSEMDEFYVNIWDWTVWGETMFPALAIDGAGTVETSPGVSASVVPTPAAMILGIVGLSHAGYLCRKRARQGCEPGR